MADRNLDPRGPNKFEPGKTGPPPKNPYAGDHDAQDRARKAEEKKKRDGKK